MRFGILDCLVMADDFDWRDNGVVDVRLIDLASLILAIDNKVTIDIIAAVDNLSIDMSRNGV